MILTLSIGIICAGFIVRRAYRDHASIAVLNTDLERVELKKRQDALRVRLERMAEKS